jgi:hypothetical protein
MPKASARFNIASGNKKFQRFSHQLKQFNFPNNIVKINNTKFSDTVTENHDYFVIVKTGLLLLLCTMFISLVINIYDMSRRSEELKFHMKMGKTVCCNICRSLYLIDLVSFVFSSLAGYSAVPSVSAVCSFNGSMTDR